MGNKFLGIKIPEKIAKEIYEKFFPFAKDSLKYISLEKPENYHFTLKFYGNIELTDSDKETMEKIKEISSFTCTLNGSGSFNNRILFVNALPVSEFDEFVKLLKPDKFSPHTTIARNRNRKFNLKDLIFKLQSISYTFFVDKVSLFETQHTEEGKQYVAIEEFKLKKKAI